MALTKSIPPEAEQAIVSYDFTELAGRTGIDVLFGVASKSFTEVVTYQLLTNSTVWSAVPTTILSTTGKNILNFDTPKFEIQRTARGTAYASFAIGLNGTTAHGAALVSVVDAGGTARTITDTVSGAELTQAGSNNSIMNLIPLPVTETIIKVGEKLRFTAIQQQTNTGNSEIGHSPQNQDGTQLLPSVKHTSVMRLLMPFKIES